MYNIPFLGHYFSCFGQNTDFFWVGKKDLRFFAKNRFFSLTIFAVTCSKMVKNLKGALVWTANKLLLPG